MITKSKATITTAATIKAVSVETRYVGPLFDTEESSRSYLSGSDRVDVKTEVVVEPLSTTIADAMLFIQQSSSNLVSNAEDTMAEATQSEPKKGDSEEKSTQEDTRPWRKKVPFELVGRGVAGLHEMSEYLDDSKVFFGLIHIEIGSGSFKRVKSIFVHFNGEKHPKPMQRAKANKKMAAAQKLLSPYHAMLTLENKSECDIDFVFGKMGHIFTADTAVKGTSKFEIGSLKEEYKKKMAESKKKTAAEKERLERQRKKLEAQQEEERRILEEEERRKEEEERLKREAEEAERKRKEEEEAKRQAEEEEKERLRLEEEEAQRVKDEEEQKAKDAETKKKKKRKTMGGRRKTRKKKDDWSDEREWDGERIVRCIHAQTSPMNWAVFSPSKENENLKPMAYGHGDLNELRDALKPDQVQYGIMRLSFGEGRFRRNHWVFVCWSPDSMTEVDSQKEKKKRMNKRMQHINLKGWMQKAIGPFGVELTATKYEMVTLEDWIMRVRKTVVVDGEAIDAESFRKALEAEKAHFEEKKRIAEEERKKKMLEEAKQRQEEESSEDDGDGVDKEELEKNRKRRAKGVKMKKGNALVEVDKTEPGADEESKEKEHDHGIQVSRDLDDHELEKLQVPGSQDKKRGSGRKTRRASADPATLKQWNISSQLTYESVTLMKQPDSDLDWVLIEPRIR